MMKEVVWGMIGCGDVTEKKTAPSLYKAEGSRLKAVYSRTKEKAEDWVQRHGHAQVYETVEELLADQEINAVYIATPPASHFDYAIQILEAEKVPLIEKPMASTYEQCQAIIKLGEEKNLPVYVNFYRRGLDKINKIKELLEKDTIGIPLTIESRHFAKAASEDYDRNNLPWRLRPEAGGGKALDTQVHVLDYLSYLFGEISSVKGFAENRRGLYEVEDTTVATFRFKNGVLATATWCYVADYYLDEVTVTGTKGKMSFSGTGVTDLIVNGQAMEFESPEHVGLAYIQRIINELLGKGKSPANTIQAARTIQIFDELLKDNYRK